MNKLFVKTFGHFVVMHADNRLEMVDPGSVVAIPEEDARRFVERGLGEFHEGPEHYLRAGLEAVKVERPGLDTRQARAERAVSAPQAQRA
jgi:hypothetical protein